MGKHELRALPILLGWISTVAGTRYHQKCRSGVCQILAIRLGSGCSSCEAAFWATGIVVLGPRDHLGGGARPNPRFRAVRFGRRGNQSAAGHAAGWSPRRILGNTATNDLNFAR